VALDKMLLVTAAHDAFNARDLDRFLDSWAENCEYTPAVEMALEPGRPYRGHDGLRLYWERIEDRWEELRTRLDEVKDLGELAFVSGSFCAVGRQSHVALESPLFEVVAFRSSKILTCSDYLDRDAAVAELEQGLP
jgi:ketosteroid isomerase-like protein